MRFLWGVFFFCVTRAEIFFYIDDDCLLSNNDFIKNFFDTREGGEIDIFSPQFYLTERVRINTTFMIGTSQKVIYLNYPFTFSNDSVQNMMKKANTSGIVILKDQPDGTMTSNLYNTKSIVPIAYFTLQPFPLGWQIYSPADFYSGSSVPTYLSFYNSNIYVGKKVGPQYNPFNYMTIDRFLSVGGGWNTILGNESGNFPEGKLYSYNTVVGSNSGNYIGGAFNSFYGTYHGSKNVINTYILTQDYYSGDNYSNYNNSFGFGNYNLTRSNASDPKLYANKQNNVFGNLNFSSVIKGFRNCIFGNRILTTTIDNITQFSFIDSNIMIGNNIFYQTNNHLISGLYGNILLIPNGDQISAGGLGMSMAFDAYSDLKVIQSDFAIMIGSCGLPIPYPRSYKTFIGNIYHSSLAEQIKIVSEDSNIKELGFIGKTSLPVVTMTNNADQVGQMEILPFGKRDAYRDEPGNVFDVTEMAEYLFDPVMMPVVGVAFKNIPEGKKNGLLYTIDSYAILNNAKNTIIGQKSNPLASFLIYKTAKNPLPYQSDNSIVTASYLYSQSSVSNELEVCGYEHYYLIPLLVKACQLLNTKITNLYDLIIAQKNTREVLYQEKIDSCHERIAFLEDQIRYLLIENDKKKS